MPTAAKLMAAVLYAAFGFWAALLFVAHHPEGIMLRMAPEKLALIGAIGGWVIMGGDVGRGYGAAILTGMRTILAMLFWALVINGFSIAVMRGMDQAYHSVIAFLQGALDQILLYGRALGQADVVFVLCLAAVLGGLATEWVARRWS